MRREASIVFVQTPLYLETVSGYKTVVNGVAFNYYKDKKDYKVVLGMNGAILGSAKTVKKVEELINDFSYEIYDQILQGKIDVDKEVREARAKPLYSDWVKLAQEIENEIGIDVQFAVRGSEVSYMRLVQYLRDNPDFNDMMNTGYDINDAILECFGEDIYRKVCKFIGMERIVDNGI